jgi:hypothetical protein
MVVAEMVVPEVNKEMLTDLEGMGFSTARATRALHFSGMFISVVGFSCCNVLSALTETRKSYTWPWSENFLHYILESWIIVQFMMPYFVYWILIFSLVDHLQS